MFTRNALHQIPDFWKAIALDRIGRVLRPGGILLLRDLVYDFRPAEAESVFEEWFDHAATDPARGYTRGRLRRTHPLGAQHLPLVVRTDADRDRFRDPRRRVHAADVRALPLPQRRRRLTPVTVLLCVLLWARDGEEDALVEYEDRVLALLPDHGARVRQRVRSDGGDGAPLEVHVLEFPSEAALDAYMADERRVRVVGAPRARHRAHASAARRGGVSAAVCQAATRSCSTTSTTWSSIMRSSAPLSWPASIEHGSIRSSGLVASRPGTRTRMHAPPGTLELGALGDVVRPVQTPLGRAPLARERGELAAQQPVVIGDHGRPREERQHQVGNRGVLPVADDLIGVHVEAVVVQRSRDDALPVAVETTG